MTDTTSIKHPTPLTSGDFTAAEEPFALFGEWFAEAVKSEPNDPNAKHARELAGELAPSLAGPGLVDAAAQCDVVAGDLGAALAFAAEEDPHTALRIAAALPRWWRFRGREVTGRRWLQRLLDDPRTADADPRVRACAEMGLAHLTVRPGRKE